MNCYPCRAGNHDYCRNKTFKDGTPRPEELKTQCTCQHNIAPGGIDSTQCKHLKIVEATRYCAHCNKSIPLTMTKEQAISMLYSCIEEWKNQSNDKDRNEVLSMYAERFLNDRPTRSRSEAETSTS